MKHITHTRLSAAALILSATFFSCDKDNQISDKPTPSEEVFIQIHTLEIAEGNEADLTRAASLEEPEYTPTGDGLLVNMSIEENEDESLRAEKDLIPNAYFRVIAVKTGTSEYVSHGDFRQGGEPTVLTFTVPSNATYDFICLSYNNTINTLPSPFAPDRGDDISTETLSGDLENLLWQKKTYPVGNTDPSLSFLLDYKAARVRVVVDCTYNNWTITNIANTMKLNSVALAQSVNLMDGNPSGGSLAEQTVTWHAPLSASIKQTSNPFIVMPTSNSVNLTVSIPVGSISRQTYQPIPTEAGFTGKFTATLQGGHSYNLLVKLKAPKFAGSNIYWNGQLTFDLHGVTGNQYFQGVYFRYGSLMGVSASIINYVDNSTPVYIPGVGKTTHGSWATVPYTSSGSIGADNITARTGDICRYLGTINTNLAGYRLPTISEFGITGGEAAWNTTTPIRGGWVNGMASWPAGDSSNKMEEGKSVLSGFGYARNLTLNDLRFPSSGYRWLENGYMNEIGICGFYRTNTSLVFAFAAANINSGRSMEREFGFSVRCVMN
jgi:hypothetical protein